MERNASTLQGALHIGTVAVGTEHSGSWKPCKIGYVSFYTPVLSEGFCFTETDNNKFGKKEKGREVATDVTTLTKRRKKNSDKDSNVGTETESTDCSES